MVFFMNYMIYGEVIESGILITGSFFIIEISYLWFLPTQGVFPVKSSKNITPRAKISLLNEYLFLSRHSNGIYRGVPKFIFYKMNYSVQYLAKPKSPIFQLFPNLIILAGLMSLWIIPLLTMYLKASIICIMMARALSSVRCLCNLIISCRSPCGQY